MVRCSGWKEVQLQGVGRGITVMYGVCKDVFNIPMTMDCRMVKSMKKVMWSTGMQSGRRSHMAALH